jgi:hypothetical protein
MKRLKRALKIVVVVSVILAYITVIPGLIYYTLTGYGFTDVIMAIDERFGTHNT